MTGRDAQGSVMPTIHASVAVDAPLERDLEKYRLVVTDRCDRLGCRPD